MNVTKLLISFDFQGMNPEEAKKQFSTLCQNFEKLFQMPTLKEIWTLDICFSEVKKAIVIGLQQQSHFCFLDKIQLRYWQESSHIFHGDEITFNYTKSEIKILRNYGVQFSVYHIWIM